MSALRRTTLLQGPPGPPGAVEASASWTPGSLSPAAIVSLNVTVTGALVGFPAWAGWSTTLPDGVFFWAQVTAPNTVRVSMINASGSNQNISAGTVLVEALIQ